MLKTSRTDTYTPVFCSSRLVLEKNLGKLNGYKWQGNRWDETGGDDAKKPRGSEAFSG